MVLQNTDTVPVSVPKVNSIILLLSLALIACQSILSCVPNTFESLKKLQNLIVISTDINIFTLYDFNCCPIVSAVWAKSNQLCSNASNGNPLCQNANACENKLSDHIDN